MQAVQEQMTEPETGPRAFKTNLLFAYLMPVGGDFAAATFATSPDEEGARLPSARVALSTQTNPTFGIHLGGLRLAPDLGEVGSGGGTVDTPARYALMAGVAGFRLNLTKGRVRLAPYVEGGAGPAQVVVDLGGFTSTTGEYVPRWVRNDGLFAGGGGGLELDLILGPGFTFSFLGGYYHFQAMDTELEVDPISSPFIGGGLSLTFKNRKWYWRTSGMDDDGPMIAVVQPRPDENNVVMIGDSVGTLHLLTSDLAGVTALWVNRETVPLTTTSGSPVADIPVIGEARMGQVTLSLHPGPNTVRITGVDGAGNQRTRQFEVHGIPLDREAPVIAILTPDEGATIQEQAVTVTGIVADQGEIPEISVNGMTPRISNASEEDRAAAGIGNPDFVAKRFEVTVPVQAGTNSLRVVAQDTAAQQNSLDFDFQGPAPVVAEAERPEREEQPVALRPVITVTRPSEWNTSNTRGLSVQPKPRVKSSMFVEGYVRYANGIREVKIAGARAAITPDASGQVANFSGFVPVEPGVNQVMIEAVGQDGQVTQETFPLQPEQAAVAAAEPSSFSSFTDNREQQRWAVVIGISDYMDPEIPDLAYADDDAQAVYDFLTSPEAGTLPAEEGATGGVPEDHIRLLLNENATARNIRSALLTFLRNSTDDDIILVYIAGHGMPDPQRLEDLYLLAFDTELADLAATGVPMNAVNEAINKAYAYNKVVITDACHSAGVGASGTRAVNVNQINAAFTDYINSSSGGFVTFTSSEGTQLSQEGEQYGGGHGVFTYYLLEGLRGEADEDGDRIVTLGEMMEYTRTRVRRETQSSQIPTISLTNFDRFWPMSIVTREDTPEEETQTEQPPEAR